MRPILYRKLVSALLLAAATLGPAQTPSTTPSNAATSLATESRIDALLAKLSTAQKLELIGGSNGFYIHAEPAIGLPALRMADGPVGIRNPGPSTAYPAGIALAATFDADLAFAEGSALGRDARSRGVSFLLGPGVNLYRAPMNGRNFEYFGEDPFLASRIAVNYIEGVQKQGVSATVKHFALNNEEYDRHHIDVLIDERTLRELYLPSFEAAVREANVGAIMDSYNLVNGVHASQNGTLNNQIAKQEWGFSGIVMSDWNSVYDGVAAANGGLDLEMPSAKFMSPATLNPAVANGTLSQATLDDKVRRILRVAVRMGWLDRPQTLDAPPNAPQDDPASRAIARKVALESITLLKNDTNLLPLDASKLCTLAVIGPNAAQPVVGGGGSAQVIPVAAISLVAALTAALPKTPQCPGVVFARGLPTYDEIFAASTFTHGIAEQFFTTPDVTAKPDTTHTRDHLIPSTTTPSTPSTFHSARWIADYTPQTTGPVLIFVALGTQDSVHLTVNGKPALSILKPEGRPIVSATVDGIAGQPLHIDLTAQLKKGPEGIGLGLRPASALVSDEARSLASKADAVILAAGYDPHTEGEGFDRSFSLPGGQNELIHEIASRNPHTIVAVDAGGGFDTAPWLASVPALLHLWYPGEEGAPALADILLGKADPEGHLPISIERTLADNPAHDSYFPGPGSTPDHPQIRLTEGVFLGYRFYTGSATKPLFPFGFGLSYTQFAFSHLHADYTPQGVVVTLDVKNTGTRSGGDAIQIYVGDPSATVKRPAEELKAFRKVHLESKEAAHLEFTLDRRAFSWWNPATHRWQLDPGKFTILAGDASDHLPLTADIEINASTAQPPPGTAQPPPAAPQAPPANVLFPTNPAPAYTGAKEYSLNIDATKIDYSTKEHTFTAPFSEKTRVMEQLSNFFPKIVATDKWGGRLDHTEPTTGFFYTKKIGHRWYAIDPEGHPYFHQALVALSPNSGPNGKPAMDRMYGDKATWMTRTHALLLQNGFNGAGAWSDADAIRHSALQPSHPLAYTVILDVMSSYGRKRGGMHADTGHAGYLNNVIFAFDPDFATFADAFIKSKVEQFVGDPALFGYFSDNEMPIRRSNLDSYLSLPKSEPGYIAAKKFMEDHHANSPNDDLRKEFLGIEIDRYASVISAALKKYDPHHMYIGCRYTGDAEKEPVVFSALGKYADAISVNYYNVWTPDINYMSTWEQAAQKPIMITEWYVKGADSGMPNKTGAGWLVRSQAERGDFYQNYVLALIQSRVVIGWHWFKYQDNDANDPNADSSNKDSNKGIVNIQYQPYAQLLTRMKQLNPNAYALADYFDARARSASQP